MKWWNILWWWKCYYWWVHYYKWGLDGLDDGENDVDGEGENVNGEGVDGDVFVFMFHISFFLNPHTFFDEVLIFLVPATFARHSMQRYGESIIELKE